MQSFLADILPPDMICLHVVWVRSETAQFFSELDVYTTQKWAVAQVKVRAGDSWTAAKIPLTHRHTLRHTSLTISSNHPNVWTEEARMHLIS